MRCFGEWENIFPIDFADFCQLGISPVLIKITASKVGKTGLGILRRSMPFALTGRSRSHCVLSGSALPLIAPAFKY
jgi:hypothetical protein